MPTLISNKNKYIFIHIPKCAGTSIASYLNDYENKSYLVKFFNYCSIKIGIKKKIVFNSSFNPIIFPKLIHDHEKAGQLRKIIGINIYNQYFKFCFVRNPWSRSLSRYNYFNSVSKFKISFKDFLLRDFQPQKERISDSKGNIIVDFIGRYENFEDDLKEILFKIDIEFKKEKLPHSNKTKIIKDYRKHYNEECFSIVKDKYFEDIKFFNYKF